ncbi:DUF3037 family protein [Motilibacter rhizosphaerae]|uniref:DUF3037 family protein n=1 Tax=Motilibacter rhizosphaerae TaxID=598652 RepID=A0A4Q7NRL1_9ACTN|nr:DUF3037 domain-containing protein [Motilibacter rhizosphaerae]RZS87280.1 DUF3037 family protein [Motilibacter rhizosphaerae]
MPGPAERVPFEWALLRVVPRVERGELVNAGVLVYCQAADVLEARLALDEPRLLALDPHTDVPAVRAHLDAVAALCAGDPATGASGQRSRGERFRWLVAPRSTVVQAGPVHTGVSAEPSAEGARLLARLVLPVGGAG